MPRRLAVMRAVKLDETPERIESRQDYVESVAESIQNFYQFYLGGGFEARGFAVPYEGSFRVKSALPRRFYWKDSVDEFMEGQDFDPNMWHMIGNGRCCGEGILGKMQSARCSNMRCDVATDVHEIGHSGWNLMHSGKVYLATGAEFEYGDNAGAMMSGASGNKMVGINAPHLIQMGLCVPHLVTGSETFNLAPVEVDAPALRDNEHRCAIIHRDNHPDLCLSTRMTSVHRFALPERYEGMLFVHRMDDKNACMRYYPDTRPGQDVDIHGVTIRHLGYENESLTVEAIL